MPVPNRTVHEFPSGRKEVMNQVDGLEFVPVRDGGITDKSVFQ